MNMTLMIFLIEAGVILLAVIGIIIFFKWKNKKLQTASFEQLVNNIKEAEEERKGQLIQFLIDSHNMPEEEAKESGEYMLEAERQFLEQFVTQQIEQTPIVDFYTHLCELLDQYLYFIPTSEAKVQENEVVEVADEIETETIQEIESLPDDDGATEDIVQDAAKEEEPDWGEAFAESGDEVDESVKDGYEAEVKDTEEKEEEPDWGEAFAESGDEVDEAVKEGYDSEVKSD